MAVVLETSIGDITIDLYTKERPRCCLNFLKLCKMKYYNFSLFHSVQRNLVAQTGDPTGTGRGGHSIYKILYGDQAAYFDAELKPRLKHKMFGTVSMVNNGNNMHGSQFFITLGENIDYLDRQMHTIFGQVGDGFDIVKKFNETFVDSDNRPFKDIRIYHTVILEDPFDDPDGLSDHIPDSSPQPTKQQLESMRIGVDEDINDDEGLSKEELEEREKQKEAHANAQILEMIGDLPTMDVKPPDNVLFVCKLNPVTTSEDLEIIFSRFGPIECCEVIRDRKSNESLQYAFIEFTNEKDCESAYFKMDNVLIDDRRIHVDFSQSVSKVKWNRKGKDAEIKKNDKDERPQFRIKDPDFRKDTKYDLVFDDDDDKDDISPSTRKVHDKKQKKEKKHKKYRKHSSDSDDSHSDHYKKQGKQSEAQNSSEKHRSGKSTDQRHHATSRTRRPEDSRERSLSPDRRRYASPKHLNQANSRHGKDSPERSANGRKQRSRSSDTHNSKRTEKYYRSKETSRSPRRKCMEKSENATNRRSRSPKRQEHGKGSFNDRYSPQHRSAQEQSYRSKETSRSPRRKHMEKSENATNRRSRSPKRREHGKGSSNDRYSPQHRSAQKEAKYRHHVSDKSNR